MHLIAELKRRARALRSEALALYLAARHPRTPWYAKLLGAAVVAYALSPIDLIPDFIPILGYLDDLILVPLGIAAVIRLIPADVMIECRAQVERDADAGTPKSRTAAAVIVAIWVAMAAACAAWGYEWLSGRW